MSARPLSFLPSLSLSLKDNTSWTYEFLRSRYFRYTSCFSRFVGHSNRKEERKKEKERKGREEMAVDLQGRSESVVSKHSRKRMKTRSPPSNHNIQHKFGRTDMISTSNPALVLPLKIDLTDEERKKLFETWTFVSSPLTSFLLCLSSTVQNALKLTRSSFLAL